MAERAAVLLDGGFVKKKLEEQTRRIPDAAAIVALTSQIMQKPRLQDASLLRAYFYDAPPFTGSAKNPLTARRRTSRTLRRLSAAMCCSRRLNYSPTSRLGGEVSACRGGSWAGLPWRITLGPTPARARDLVPDISQKGVDLRIGLDIA